MATNPSATRPWGRRHRGSRSHRAAEGTVVRLRSRAGVLLITATVLSSMAGFVDATVVNVAVPAIGRDLGASLVALQWTLTGYLLTAATLLLVAGALADRYGRRRVLVTGLAVMLVASVACAAAPSFPVLIGGADRAGGGRARWSCPAASPCSTARCGPQDRAPGIGVWAGLASLGSLVGPFVGGWLVDHASWRAVFLLNVPLVLGAVLALVPVPDSVRLGRPALAGRRGRGARRRRPGRADRRADRRGAGWAGRVPGSLTELIIGAACLLALVPVERRVRAPMLKLSLFASRQFTAINAATVAALRRAGRGGLPARAAVRAHSWGTPRPQAGAVLIPSSVIFLALSPGQRSAGAAPRRALAHDRRHGRLRARLRSGSRRAAPAATPSALLPGRRALGSRRSG